MNVLDESNGSVATFPQNTFHPPVAFPDWPNRCDVIVLAPRNL